MKKIIATICLAVGIVSTSFATNPSAPNSPNVSYAQENKNDTPDVVILIVDSRGVIVDIIVIKKR